MRKSLRNKVFEKYNGKCAYCGCGLTNGQWQVDHIKPQVSGGADDLDNLNPSCADCNRYKGGAGLELFRKHLNDMLNVKFEYLFKSKTKMQVAINMGCITHTKWDGKFYFEKLQIKGL